MCHACRRRARSGGSSCLHGHGEDVSRSILDPDGVHALVELDDLRPRLDQVGDVLRQRRDPAAELLEGRGAARRTARTRRQRARHRPVDLLARLVAALAGAEGPVPATEDQELVVRVILPLVSMWIRGQGTPDAPRPATRGRRGSRRPAGVPRSRQPAIAPSGVRLSWPDQRRRSEGPDVRRTVGAAAGPRDGCPTSATATLHRCPPPSSRRTCPADTVTGSCSRGWTSPSPRVT